MKTPREILLARHRAAEPQLDTIRATAVAAACKQPTETDAAPSRRSQNAVATLLQLLWRELIWPSRHIWAGIAAAWVVIVVVNLHDAHDTKMAGNSFTPISPAVLMAMREPDRWFSEFAEPHETPAADRPKQAVPKPRSEWHSGLFQT